MTDHQLAISIPGKPTLVRLAGW